jgi:hypothetical protein
MHLAQDGNRYVDVFLPYCNLFLDQRAWVTIGIVRRHPEMVLKLMDQFPFEPNLDVKIFVDFARSRIIALGLICNPRVFGRIDARKRESIMNVF